jgi:hypothetical protein
MGTISIKNPYVISTRSLLEVLIQTVVAVACLRYFRVISRECISQWVSEASVILMNIFRVLLYVVDFLHPDIFLILS